MASTRLLGRNSTELNIESITTPIELVLDRTLLFRRPNVLLLDPQHTSGMGQYLAGMNTLNRVSPYFFFRKTCRQPDDSGRVVRFPC